MKKLTDEELLRLKDRVEFIEGFLKDHMWQFTSALEKYEDDITFKKFDPDYEEKRKPIRFGYDENGKFIRIKDEHR